MKHSKGEESLPPEGWRTRAEWSEKRQWALKFEKRRAYERAGEEEEEAI